MEGSNILGFFPGKFWNTAKDRPLIIAGHWDTVETTKGFNDNGSGVTVMLEISRILIGSKCFVPDFTIIFVAFDAEEEGAIGTQQLINSIIVPYYKRQGVDIQVKLLSPCVTQRKITDLIFFANNKIRREMGFLSLSAEFFDFKG